MGININIP